MQFNRLHKVKNKGEIELFQQETKKSAQLVELHGFVFDEFVSSSGLLDLLEDNHY